MNLVGSVLFGCEDIVVPFVQSRVPYMQPFERRRDGSWTCTALGVVRNDNIIGGVVYHQHSPSDGNIMVGIAFDRSNWAFPATLRTLFAYPFEQLNCIRITALIGRRNKKSRRICEGLGFKLEGCCRKALGRNEDCMVYGLLRDDCRFLRARNGTKGQQQPAPRT